MWIKNLSLKYLISNKRMKLPRLGFCEKKYIISLEFSLTRKLTILQKMLLKGVLNIKKGNRILRYGRRKWLFLASFEYILRNSQHKLVFSRRFQWRHQIKGYTTVSHASESLCESKAFFFKLGLWNSQDKLVFARRFQKCNQIEGNTTVSHASESH